MHSKKKKKELHVSSLRVAFSPRERDNKSQIKNVNFFKLKCL